MTKAELQRQLEHRDEQRDSLMASNKKLSGLAEAQGRYIQDLESLLRTGKVVDREPTTVFIGGGGGCGGAGGGYGGAMR